MMKMDSIITLLCSPKKLERDSGVSELQQYLVTADNEKMHALQTALREVLENRDSPWEAKHGVLLGIKSLVSKLNICAIDAPTRCFLDKICDCSLELLTDSEVRVRLGAGDVLGSLCKLEGPQVYEKAKDRILELIQTNIERESKDSSSELPDETEDVEEMSHTRQRRLSSDAAQIFHDTAGWKFLETSMKCLQSMVDGCGAQFKPWIQQELLDLLFQALKHTNRFVRETGYYVLGSLVSSAISHDEQLAKSLDFSQWIVPGKILQRGSNFLISSGVYNPFTTEYFGHQISKQLGIGLGDNWSQVRLAASEGSRKFLLSFETDEEREVFFPELLPKLCLNRYYIADGVRIYSQETWRKVAKTDGRDLVKKYINNFVDYYIAQTKADNHAVREAACACIAELASKIEQDATKPHVPLLLQTLLDCFRDDSWPVRDAACLACGNFILCYPNESRSVMNALYPMFFINLKDTIPSVRQGAAGALANVAKAYGSEAFIEIEGQIVAGLKGVENQPSESEKYGQLEKGPATFSVVKKMRDNDMELHTDRQMYSCGSLAPKMGRGGGCSDHKFRKPSEPWELADGCIHLIAELAQIEELVPKVIQFLPFIVQATNYKHYTHHVCLLESLCKQLPNIGKGIGKRCFKQYLEMFLEIVFYSLTCENALTSSAASQCLYLLSQFLGPNAFRARVEQLNPSYLPLLDDSLPHGNLPYAI